MGEEEGCCAGVTRHTEPTAHVAVPYHESHRSLGHGFTLEHETYLSKRSLWRRCDTSLQVEPQARQSGEGAFAAAGPGGGSVPAAGGTERNEDVEIRYEVNGRAR